MKHLIFITICLGLLMACIGCRRNITATYLQPKALNLPKLPHLVPVVDVYATPVQGVFVAPYPSMYYPGMFYPGMPYPSMSDTFAGRQPALLPPVLDSMENRRIRSTYYQNANADEMLVYFACNVERNLSRSEGPAKGYISCRINIMETPQAGIVSYLFLHGITMGSLLLVGVPSRAARCYMEIEVVVRDKNNQPIKRYLGTSSERKYSGAYYGYRWTQVQRATNLAAFKEALAQVNDQIAADHAFLEEKLR